MNQKIRPSRKLHVMTAIVVVLLLAASFGVRLASTSERAEVPAPRPFLVTELEIPAGATPANGMSSFARSMARAWPRPRP
jgi:hypothetical protein